MASYRSVPTMLSAEDATTPPRFPRSLERHLVSTPIAFGGMASVHVAMSADRSQPMLALKRVHPHLASEHFTKMLLDEAAITSCIRHPNVVTTYGADMIGDEVFMVMEYVPGLPFHALLQRARPGTVPRRFAVAVIAAALRGLHAAHEAVDANGKSLAIVHRDVSPQNILIGLDGVPRVLDFGIAKAEHREQGTCVGQLKGKLSYMAPEQLREQPVDRRTDVYAAAVVLWEALVGASLFNGRSDGSTYANALRGCTSRPGKHVSGVPVALDAVVMRGLATDPKDRFATALDMARALGGVLASDPVHPSELAAWVHEEGGDALRKQAHVSAELRRRSSPSRPAPVRRTSAAPVAPEAPAVTPPLDQSLAIRAALFFAGSACGLLLAIAISSVLAWR